MHARRTRSGLLTGAGLVAGILVTAFGAPAGAAPPSNDDIGAAVTVTGSGFTDTRDTSEATVAAGDPGCGAATVWYTFTPATDGDYMFDTIGSDYDTMLALLEGSPGDLTLLQCVDDNVGVQSAIVASLTAGTTYYIQAGTCCGGDVGQVGPGGNLVFNVDNAPPPFDVEVTLDRQGRVGSEPGTATVSGTVTCNTESYVYVTGTLRQKQGLAIARADYYIETPCSTTPTAWSVTVDAGTRVFLPKSATLTATSGGCDQFTCDEDTETRSVKLRR